MASKNNKKPAPEKNGGVLPPGSKNATARAFVIFLICACMFTLGVFIGRGTAPVRFDIEKLEKELATLRAAVVQKERQQAKVYRQAIENRAKLEFYEALKETGPAEHPIDTLKNKAPAAQTHKTQPAPAVKTSGTAVGAATETRSETPRKNYTIQVASVKTKAAAEAMVARLKKKGYGARHELGKVPGRGIWFRVRVGYFSNRAAADRTLTRLRKDRIEGMVLKL